MIEHKDTNAAFRRIARSYEETLSPSKRKRLGQYFSGIPLGKLLAHIALSDTTRTVLDPMAGHGDLLDATWEAARERGIELKRLDGVEVDAPTARVCRHRLTGVDDVGRPPERHIVAADAFAPSSSRTLPVHEYDLVITNPPYVRYQRRLSRPDGEDPVRKRLLATVTSRLQGLEGKVWRILIENYSGQADLSVPAWILAGALVSPGGRLALVVPATWRSRDYADVIRYLMMRCFAIEAVVEDRQPGWFSKALVRTHLIVARRLSSSQVARPLALRESSRNIPWIQISPRASGRESLVGAAWRGACPERKFSTWLHGGCEGVPKGISSRLFGLRGEFHTLHQRNSRRRWYVQLEPDPGALPLFSKPPLRNEARLPEPLAEVIPAGLVLSSLVTLEDVGVKVSQGLRTGCNGFFYVTAIANASRDDTVIQVSRLFGGKNLCVPTAALKPVLRRQSELPALGQGRVPTGRVLDLRSFVLVEDLYSVNESRAAYSKNGEIPPGVMPNDLATYVRSAAAMRVGPGKGKRIPTMSAVRTNVRSSRRGTVTPRFWYMLPDFQPRHLPAGLIPRVNHGPPRAHINLEPPILVDANFSTVQVAQEGWTSMGLQLFLNSAWCRAAMEALGTPMGGGALKLEATQLRHMPVPDLTARDKTRLTEIATISARDQLTAQHAADQIVLRRAAKTHRTRDELRKLATTLLERCEMLSRARRRR